MQGPLATKGIRVSIIAIWTAIALLAVHVTVDLNRSHTDATDRGIRLTTSYVRLVAEHAAATFDRADLVLEQAVRLPSTADQSAARMLSEARRATLEAELKSLQAKAQGIVSMSMTDRDGYVYANTVGTPPGGFLGDRAYFLALKTGASAGPVVSEVIKGRISNKWGIQIARRIATPNGGFGGMVVANIGMSEYLEKFYETLSLGPDSAISLRDTKHRLLVRHPASDGSIGKVIPSEALDRLFATGAVEGWYFRPSPVDGIDRIVAVKKLDRYDIYAAVGIPESDIFGAWTRSRTQSIIILGLALAAATIATTLSYWKAQSDEALRNQLSFQDALFDTLPIPIFARDRNGLFITCNKAYERYFGTPKDVLIGKTAYDLFPQDLADEYMTADREIIDGRGAKTYQTTVIAANGDERRVVIDKARYQSADSLAAGIVATVIDVTDRENMQHELWRLATTDPLTNVGNRRHFLAIAESEMVRVHRHDRPVSVITFDIDHFKQINDRYGHGIGDDTIRAVVDTCAAILRDNDVIGRMGGEEFAILLPETELPAATEVAKRLLERVGALCIDTETGTFTLTASFGVTQVRDEDATIDITLRRADAALYDAKNSGRNRVMARA
ncbi:putative Diguanylate cyclase [Candidatus Terasakiella magnetica]|nr:putative Diguanylate cyclase [Candidatus Terasakiella magnetica]